MAKKILNVATFGLLGALTKPFGTDKPKVAEPVAGPKVMPLADDEAIKRAKKASILKQMARGGRTSTMLSSDDSGSMLGN